MTEPRFFIDHGLIHDRATGKHVTTGEDTAFEDGIEACCKLLNEISTSADELHAMALGRACVLMDAKPGTPDGAELDKLASVIERYETARFPTF